MTRQGILSSGSFSPHQRLVRVGAGVDAEPEIEGEKCTGAVAFCTIDCPQGYWQYSLAEVPREYFTFVTKGGLFTPTRVPQGSTNAK